MMTATLSLAASPPYRGLWIPIGHREEWVPVTLVDPPLDVSDAITIEVIDENGEVTEANGNARGIKARALIRECKATAITILLEEREV